MADEIQRTPLNELESMLEENDRVDRQKHAEADERMLRLALHDAVAGNAELAITVTRMQHHQDAMHVVLEELRADHTTSHKQTERLTSIVQGMAAEINLLREKQKKTDETLDRWTKTIADSTRSGPR